MVQNRYPKIDSPTKDVRNLFTFFGLTYLCHGFSCAQFGLLAQPIQYFFMKGLNLDAAQSSTLMATMMLPWVVKPIYGLVCDFIPLFGYRRKSYLAVVNFICSLSFGLVCIFATLDYKLLLGCLAVAAICMAVSTALLVGTATERGRADNQTHYYFGIQETAYYSANIVAAVYAGYICQTTAPLQALKYSAGMAFFPSAVVSVLTVLMLKEPKAKLNLRGFQKTKISLISASRSRELWLVAILALLWNFIPCFGVPLYYFESKKLLFAQAAIGNLAAWNSLGMLLGSISYTFLFKRLTMAAQLLTTAGLLTVSVLSFCFLSSMTSAIFIEIFHGFANIIAILSVYIIATRVCPRRIEITVMAVLVAVRNIATDGATYIGGQLVSNVFHDSYPTLAVTSCLAPALSFVVISALLKYFKQKDERINSSSKTEIEIKGPIVRG